VAGTTDGPPFDDLRTALDVKLVTDESGGSRVSLAMPSREKLGALVRGLADLLGAPPLGAAADGPSLRSRTAQVDGERALN
jgi:hypothetical protein